MRLLIENTARIPALLTLAALVHHVVTLQARADSPSEICNLVDFNDLADQAPLSGSFAGPPTISFPASSNWASATIGIDGIGALWVSGNGTPSSAEITFDEPVGRVGFDYLSSVNVTLKAFDSAGDQVGQETGNDSTTEVKQLEIAITSNVITRVVIEGGDFATGIDNLFAFILAEPSDILMASDFLPPMGKKKKVGSTLPVKFHLSFDGVAITSQAQLDEILADNGFDESCPEIVLFDVTDMANEISLPEDLNNVGGGGDLGICFRFSDNKCIYNLKLDSDVFDSGSTYMVNVRVAGSLLDPGNFLFQTK